MKISPLGSEFFPCGRTDRHNEANSGFFAISRKNAGNFKNVALFFPLNKILSNPLAVCSTEIRHSGPRGIQGSYVRQPL